MCHHIKPQSVGSYLSGICNTLEPHFPNVRTIRSSLLVTRSLDGMKKLRGSDPPHQKQPLSEDSLLSLLSQYNSISHDDLLFCSIKLTMRHTLLFTDAYFSFLLPYHKADRFFQGNTILVEKRSVFSPLCAHTAMASYLQSRDRLFPFHPELWLTSLGAVPTYSWFVKRLHSVLGLQVGGHSIRSGSATALALAGAAGRWTSETFRIYIRKHPVLLQALLHGRTLFEHRA
ncbi:hypothetical protein K439DRAFT_1646287 [Ramaria rubella]|nr:hypothetical protein K439DRAFT_1646287 [Ramaria rubella]